MERKAEWVAGFFESISVVLGLQQKEPVRKNGGLHWGEDEEEGGPS